MKVIKLSEIDSDTKRILIRKVGFETQSFGRGWKLIDKKYNADEFIETFFRSLDEVVSVLAGYLLRVGYIVTV